MVGTTTNFRTHNRGTEKWQSTRVMGNGKARTKEIRLNLRDGRSAAAGAGVLQGAAGTAVTVAGNGNDGQNDHGCQQDNDYQCGGVHRTARAIK